MLDETSRNQYLQQLDTVFARFNETGPICDAIRAQRDALSEVGGLAGINDEPIREAIDTLTEALHRVFNYRDELLNEEDRLLTLIWPDRVRSRD